MCICMLLPHRTLDYLFLQYRILFHLYSADLDHAVKLFQLFQLFVAAVM